MEIKIVKAIKSDYSFLKEIDDNCFMPYQKTSDKAMLRCLNSCCNDIFIVKIKKKNRWISIASLIIHKYKITMRIVSISVLPEYRNLHIGKELMRYCIEYALTNAFNIISLEVLATNNQLVEWYEQFGFKTYDYLHDYYEEYIDAFRMRLKLH